MVHFTSNDHNDCLPQNLFCGLNNNHACRGTLEIKGNVTVLKKNMDIIFSLSAEIPMCFIYVYTIFAIKWITFILYTPQYFSLQFML